MLVPCRPYFLYLFALGCIYLPPPVKINNLLELDAYIDFVSNNYLSDSDKLILCDEFNLPELKFWYCHDDDVRYAVLDNDCYIDCELY